MRRLIVAGVAALAACAGIEEPGCTRLPEGGRYCLQQTSLVTAFQATQRVEVARDGAGYSLLAEIEVDADAMRMVVVTPLGQKLLQLEYDNRMARINAAGPLRDRLDPVLVAALVQLALWPLDAVRAGLTGGVTIEETAGHRRVLGAGGATLMSVQTEGTPPSFRKLRITAPAARLVLDIDTLPEPDSVPEERR
ncbi:MAG: DUF3261 domain-containing protein [Betaproteobacteria bacterium]|nr:DUF3261 domain-containing protein [Betaproteobacteria bacterium]